MDLYSWRIRLTGSDFEIEDEELVANLVRMGWLKRRWGHYCLTRQGEQCLREGMWAMIERRYAEAQRYEEALEEISRAYPGERDYPGQLARRGLQSPGERLMRELDKRT